QAAQPAPLFPGPEKEVGMMRNEVLHAVPQAVALRILLAQPGVAAAIRRRGDIAAERGDRLSLPTVAGRAQPSHDLQDDLVADVVEIAAVAAEPDADDAAH